MAKKPDSYIRDNLLNKQETLFRDLGTVYQNIYLHLYTGYLPNTLLNGLEGELAYLDGFHEYEKQQGDVMMPVKRTSLGMPQVISAYLKKLIFGEGVEISFGKEDSTSKADIDNWFKQFFIDNAFIKNEKDLCEFFIAVGDKTESFYKEGEKVLLNYAKANRFIVTDSDNRGVNGVVYVTSRTILEKSKTIYLTMLESHELVKDADVTQRNYEIRREIYKGDKPQMITTPLLYDKYWGHFGKLIAWEEEKDVEVPRFTFTKMPIANSKAIDSPRGQSLYGGKLDNAKVLDAVYDGSYYEFVLSQREKIIPEEMMQEIQTSKGKATRYNPAKGVYKSIGKTGDYGFDVKELASTIRDESYTRKINAEIDYFSSGCGISAGTFRFDGKSRVTATQVLQEASDSFRTKKEVQDRIAEGWKDLFVKVAYWAKKWGLVTWELKEEDITIKFDDSVIIDDQQKLKNDVIAVEAEIMPKAIFRELHYDLGDKEQARWNELLKAERDQLFSVEDEEDEDEENEDDA